MILEGLLAAGAAVAQSEWAHKAVHIGAHKLAEKISKEIKNNKKKKK